MNQLHLLPQATASDMRRSATESASSLAAALAILIGVLALLGWWLDIPVLHSVSPDLPAMVPATATLVMLCGAGLLLTPSKPDPKRRAAALACALPIMLVPFASLPVEGGWLQPSSAASLILLIIGSALALLQASRPPVLILGALSVIALTLPLYRLTESLLSLGHHHIDAAGPFATMSLNASLALSLLAGPALFLHPRLPFGRILYAPDPFGHLIRMIMPLGVVVPVVLAIIIELTVTHESQYAHFAVIAALGLMSALFTALIWRGYEKLQATAGVQQQSEALTRSIMDSLPHAIAVIDRDGTIVSVNESWRHFATENDADTPTRVGAGLNYLNSCRMSRGNAHALQALAGIEDVLAGRSNSFAFEYPCHSPDRQRWFVMRANPLLDESNGLVISHIDITERKLAELEMQRDREQQTALRQMLEAMLQKGSIEETLGHCLDLLLAVPWLAVLPRGGIHLMAENGEHLDLVVARGLASGVVKQCSHLPLDRCLCGKAAASRKTVFASHVDAQHEVTYPDMPDHGHYCVPMFGDRQEVIGVLVLYLQAGTRQDAFREQFLSNVAGILSSHILRRRGEVALQASQAALQRHQQQLEKQVTERTTDLAVSEGRTRAVLHTMADGVIQIDSSGTILLANYAISELFGYETEELIGRNISLLMPEPHRSQHDGYLASYLRTRTANVIGKRVEVRGRRKDGSTFPLEMAINELIDDVGITFIGVLRDLSLQQEMGRAQEKALAEAKRLANVKSAFLANMSHEIRTPLGAVMGFARIGMRENHGRSSHATCARILEAGEHLLGIVNDILDFSKIEAGKLKIEPRPFRTVAVIEASISFVTEAARNKGLELMTTIADDLPAWVKGDTLRVEQILTNLLSNAVKFTPRGQVKLMVRQSTGTKLQFLVEDSGIGMNTEQLGRLFQAFEQADSSTTREYGGSGLGLAISRSMARLMGGDITATSSPGRGSTFTLELPLPATVPASEPTPVVTAGSRRLAGLRLLAADDIEINRLILNDLLMQEGAQTIFATNGQQVLDLLDEHGADAFDAVLMDVQMPVLDGLDATRTLLARAPQLPVIGITAHALAEERDKCLAAGMVAHVTKPIDPDVLVTTILQHVANVPALQPIDSIPGTISRAPTFPGPLINLPALRSRFNQKGGFLHKLAASALTSLDSSERKLTAAIAQRDYEALAFTAHSLKGMAGNLFAQQVFDLAKATDDAARQKQPVAFKLTARLTDLFGIFRAELTAITNMDDEAH